MANVQDKLNNIKNALFGKDVRNSIHDGIDAINKEVESTTNRQEHLETTFDQLTINAGNSNAEIVDARVGENGKSYAKLGDRLDSVDSQLEHIAINAKSKNIVPDSDTIFNIQALIDELHLLGGGTILFDKGTYILEPFTIKENVHIKGQANGGSKLYGDWFEKDSIGTVLKCSPNASGSFITFNRSAGASISDLAIDGNIGKQSNVVNGVEFLASEEPYKPYSNSLARLENVVIINCKGDGIKASAYGQVITNCMIRDNEGYGVNFDNATDNTIMNVMIFRNDKGAVLIQNNSSHNFFIGGKWYQNNVFNRDKGQLTITNSTNQHFTNIDIQDSFGHGVFIENTSNLTFNGCNFDTSGYSYNTENSTKWDVGYIDRACFYGTGNNYNIDLGNSVVMNYLSGSVPCKYGIYLTRRAVGKFNIDNVVFGGGVEIPKTNVYEEYSRRLRTEKYDDFNLYIEQGSYFISKGSPIPNCPPIQAMYGILNVYTEIGNKNTNNNQVIIQQYIEKSKIFTRNFANNVWSEWSKNIVDDTDILPSYTKGLNIGSRDKLWNEMWATRAFLQRNGDNLWLIATDSSTNNAYMRFMDINNNQLGLIGIDNNELKIQANNKNIVLTGNNVTSYTNIVPNTSSVRELGSSTNRWNNIYLNNSPNVSSKRELKDNIKLFDDAKAYDTIKSLPIYTYNFKEVDEEGNFTGNIDAEDMLGSMLDELPIECINEKTEGVDLYAYTSYCISALKKAIEKIDNLEKEVKELKSI